MPGRVSRRPVVAMLTDFGLADHYVGSMKAALLAVAPDAQIVDITHEIPPQNVCLGAFHLLASYRDYPAGTLFLAVVDPGVGSERKILYAEAGGWRFIGPDNGLFSWVFQHEKPSRLIDVSRPPFVSKAVGGTFHGRDIMAPLAGRILSGDDPSGFGHAVADFARLPFPVLEKTGSRWRGEVIAADHYGNLITNIPVADARAYEAGAKLWFELDGFSETVRGLRRSYSEAEPGKVIAVAGSTGFVELAVRDGSARERTGAREGSAVALHFRT